MTDADARARDEFDSPRERQDAFSSFAAYCQSRTTEQIALLIADDTYRTNVFATYDGIALDHARTIAAALRERPDSYAAGVEDVDARAREIAERIADATFDSNTIGARQNPNWRMLVDRIATAIRALAPKESAKLETTAKERAQYRSYGVGFPSQDSFATRMVRDFDRLLASHKGEREDGQHAVLGPYAVIDRGCISIRVPIDILPNAFKCIPARYGLNDANGDPLYEVRDPAVFAKSVADRLNNESDDGTTAIHQMLDAAMAKAVEQGDEGVEEISRRFGSKP